MRKTVEVRSGKGRGEKKERRVKKARSQKEKRRDEGDMMKRRKMREGEWGYKEGKDRREGKGKGGMWKKE